MFGLHITSKSLFQILAGKRFQRQKKKKNQPCQKMASIYFKVFRRYKASSMLIWHLQITPNHSLINLLCAFSKPTYTELEEKHLFILLLRNQYNLHSKKIISIFKLKFYLFITARFKTWDQSVSIIFFCILKEAAQSSSVVVLNT